MNRGEVAENSHEVPHQTSSFIGLKQALLYSNGGGTLKTLKGKHVLHVWGTPEEKACATGFLCAPQMLDSLNFVVIEHY